MSDTFPLEKESVREVHIKEARSGATVLYEHRVLEECAHPNVIECYGMSEDASTLHLECGECDLYSLIVDTGKYRLETQQA